MKSTDGLHLIFPGPAFFVIRIFAWWRGHEFAIDEIASSRVGREMAASGQP